MNKYQIFTIHDISVRYIYFCHIILPSTELVKMNNLRFSCIIKCSLNLVDKGVFHIHIHCNEINNKWEHEYCCLPYMIYNTFNVTGKLCYVWLSSVSCEQSYEV
jgi:hypothetical protein